MAVLNNREEKPYYKYTWKCSFHRMRDSRSIEFSGKTWSSKIFRWCILDVLGLVLYVVLISSTHLALTMMSSFTASENFGLDPAWNCDTNGLSAKAANSIWLPQWYPGWRVICVGKLPAVCGNRQVPDNGILKSINCWERAKRKS